MISSSALDLCFLLLFAKAIHFVSDILEPL